MTTHRKSTDYMRQGRRTRLVQEQIHDPYRSTHKYPEPTVCADCGATLLVSWRREG